MGIDHHRLVRWLDERITDQPGRIVVLFLLATVVFALGLPAISTEAGTEQFTEDIPAEEALQEVNQRFTPAFAPDTGSTQLLHAGENVLARHELIRMLEAQQRLAERPHMRVTETSSVAGIVARTLDPDAESLEAQILTLEAATQPEIDRAVRAAADDPSFRALLSEDFNRGSASASATIGVVTHEVPGGLAGGAGLGGESPLTPIQQQAVFVVDSVGGDIRVFGAGIIAAEFASVIGDTLLLVVPAAVILITLFLIVAYRDLADLVLGIVGLLMAVVWTFGFTGLVGIPFSQLLIAVPPLLLAVGIDFGIHAINRYREERIHGYDIEAGMQRATHQLLVAFFIVTGTTVVGFAANLTSELIPIREFGFVAAVGIVFTFLIFGVFLPAAKVLLDRGRDRYPIPTFATTPLGGTEGSVLGRVLEGGVDIARVAPVVFVVLILVATAGAAVYATGIDTTFDDEDFLPPEEPPGYYDRLPAVVQPAEYTVTRNINFLQRHFASSEDDTVTVYVEGPMARADALESMTRAAEEPPGTIIRDGRHADRTSIVTVIETHADRDEEFAALVARNDRSGNGVPDQNLADVYDYLLDSPARDQALRYMTEDRRSARVVYSVEADASQEAVAADARELADRHRFEATATGGIVVFDAIAALILVSAIRSLAVALAGTAVFLLFIYWWLMREPLLGVANLIPVVASVCFIAGTMRAVGIPFNAFTATILAITIGLGIDYSVHVTHRFADEVRIRERSVYPALERTVRGTGGALTGSMLTTTFGIGVLVISIFPAIGQFGLLTALSVIYAYLTAIVVLPSVLVVWHRVTAGP